MGKKISLTNATLLVLEKAIDGYVRLEDFLYNPGFYAYGSWDDRIPKKSELAQAIKRLREHGFVEEDKNEQQIILKITEKGRDRAILLMEEPTNWDGKWRFVVFDIPEKRRAVRQLLRKKLISWGFTRWQKSVWACKKNCTKQVRDFVKYLGVEDWVLVIESDNVGAHTI